MQKAESHEPDELHARVTSAQPTVSRLVHRQSWKQDSSINAAPDKALGKKDNSMVQPAALETSVNDKKQFSATPDQKPSGSEQAIKEDIDAPHHTLLSVKEPSCLDKPKNLVSKPALHMDKNINSLKETVWSLVACLISLIPLVILAILAGKRASEFDKQVTKIAKHSMASLHSGALCVPGFRNEQASVSNYLGFYCTGDHGKISDDTNLSAYYTEFPLSSWTPQNPYRWPHSTIAWQQAQSMVLALHCCGAVDYFYTVDDLIAWAENLTNEQADNDFINNVSAKREGVMADDRQAACLKISSNRFCLEKISNPVSIYQSTHRDEGKCNDINKGLKTANIPKDGLVTATDRLRNTMDVSFNYNFYTNRSTYANKFWRSQDHLNYRNAQAFNGVLRIDPGNGFGIIWLGIHQDNKTAFCIGQNESTSDFWERNTGCHSFGPPSDLWLGAGILRSYKCTDDGVDVELSAIYSQFQTAAQQQLASSFLLISINSYNDLYAIYTAVLGALFGVSATAFASIITLAMQLLASFLNATPNKWL